MPAIGKAEEHSTSEAVITELDELCHDCWQRELRLTKQRENDGSSTMETDRDEQDDSGINTHVLREIFPNEFIVSPQNANLGAMSSAERLPQTEQVSQ
ncbi:hypothetical protein RRF57_007477 [Xylaria bambusicola]|uniref:Uncharacterized protein n=1 Tax=Xylaria bambusicola TaxID=326684 RepID=A0AAN7ZAM2_9PEZI